VDPAGATATEAPSLCCMDIVFDNTLLESGGQLDLLTIIMSGIG
jgi:hypothetical protein